MFYDRIKNNVTELESNKLRNKTKMIRFNMIIKQSELK